VLDVGKFWALSAPLSVAELLIFHCGCYVIIMLCVARVYSHCIVIMHCGVSCVRVMCLTGNTLIHFHRKILIKVEIVSLIY